MQSIQPPLHCADLSHKIKIKYINVCGYKVTRSVQVQEVWMSGAS